MFKGNICTHTHIKEGKKKINVEVNNIKKMQQKSGQGEKSQEIAKLQPWKQVGTSWKEVNCNSEMPCESPVIL